MLLHKLHIGISSIIENLVTLAPAEYSKLKRFFYKRKGIEVDRTVSIATNVKLKGNISIKKGSSIAQNCTLSGENAGIFIGHYVMVAPGCVFVAFDHGFDRLDVPMCLQACVESPIIIEDNVWIGANCTITKGVRIGTGSIVAANSVVTKNILPYSIVGGVPAKVIKNRKNDSVT